MGTVIQCVFIQHSSGVEDSERQQSAPLFPRRNWVIVIILKSLTSIAYIVTIPSMHQFITNPDKTTEYQV